MNAPAKSTPAGAVLGALDRFFAAEPEVLDWGTVGVNGPLPHAEELADWVAQGLHAGLRYMEAHLEQRQSPQRLFPWARSAVLFSLRPPAAWGANTGSFRVAAYALGEDYHRRARHVLAAAQKLLAELDPALRVAGFADTWPVFERDLAAEAGLGWRGKNTCLIDKRQGSGFLLAGFFLAAELQARQAPATDFCGQCTACLDQCPTGALLEPGRLDAGKCISYWTIEAKGEVPASMADQTGGWIFGCDICQEVCPWNHKHKAREASPPPDWPLTPAAWLSLLRPGGGFQSRFRRTPLARAGRKGMLRNVLIALRQKPPDASVADLIAVMADEETDPVLQNELQRTRAHFANGA